MEGFLSKVKAEVKAGVAKVESLSAESLEGGVVGKNLASLGKVMEKVEARALGPAASMEGDGTPSKSGKLSLETLTRDELLLVARSEKEKVKKLKVDAKAAVVLQHSVVSWLSRAGHGSAPASLALPELASLIDDLSTAPEGPAADPESSATEAASHRESLEQSVAELASAKAAAAKASSVIDGLRAQLATSQAAQAAAEAAAAAAAAEEAAEKGKMAGEQQAAFPERLRAQLVEAAEAQHAATHVAGEATRGQDEVSAGTKDPVTALKAELEHERAKHAAELAQRAAAAEAEMATVQRAHTEALEQVRLRATSSRVPARLLPPAR